MHARAAGLPFTAYPSVPAWPSGVCQDEQIVVVFDHLRSRRTRDEITEVVERLRPDALVIDAMMEAAYDAAARSGLPTAVLCHFLASLFCGSWAEMVMGRPAAELLAGVDRVLALTRREFDDEGAHASVSYVGPVTLPDVDSSPRALAAAGLEALVEPGNPWVLASLSTTQQNQRPILPALVEQLAELPARVLLTLGGAVDPAEVPAPGQVLVRGFVAHEVVLPHVALVVSHAGLSGISTALAHAFRDPRAGEEAARLVEERAEA